MDAIPRSGEWGPGLPPPEFCVDLNLTMHARGRRRGASEDADAGACVRAAGADYCRHSGAAPTSGERV